MLWTMRIFAQGESHREGLVILELAICQADLRLSQNSVIKPDKILKPQGRFLRYPKAILAVHLDT